MKLWGGRFKEDQNDVMKKFNDSIGFDNRLYSVDIQGSLAYAEALHLAGLLTSKENISIQQGLGKIRDEFDTGEFEIKAGDEDIHTAVERRLFELIGKTAGKLHTGRSRNDQVALDLRLFIMEEIKLIKHLLEELQQKLIEKANAHINVIMPGFTHLQPAQPILFSHWLMSFFWMFERDKARLDDILARTAVSPLGSGALAGNPFDIDRSKIAEELGMDAISMNSLDAVSDRDFVAEILFANSLIAVHISHLAEDIILFSNPAFNYLQIGEAYSTGSSLMPQKRNPDSMELARGKSGRIISALVNLLIVLKGLPSTYNKDLQEDKEALFDSVDNLKLTLSVVVGVIESLIIFPEKMSAHLNEAMLATDLADYLVNQGVPFREANQKVGELIRYTEENSVSLSEIPSRVLQNIAIEFEDDIEKIIDFNKAINKKDGVGGTAPKTVIKQIELAKEILGD
ncbi:MAG: argininosuccinate lyase [Chloroflexi bacterium]|nr:argininosuccinate lyase [Chloroflexota bacterium]